MEKKITIKDIAREAGVSVATVSYVLNDRQDQKISESTRNRVLHIANMKGYNGSRSGRPLVAGKTNCIAVCSFAPDGSPAASDHMILLRAISRVLEKSGYSAIYLCADSPSRVTNADAIICIDAPIEKFREMSGNNFIPVVSLHMVINDILFYQINVDYAAVFEKLCEKLGDDFCLVTGETGNEALHERIADIFGEHVFFAADTVSLIEFLRSANGRPLAVSSAPMHALCLAAGYESLLVEPNYDKLAKYAFDYVIKSIERTPGEGHDVIVPENS